MKKIKSLFRFTIAAFVAAFLVAAPVLALALEPEVNTINLLNSGGVTLVLDTATNAPDGKIISVYPNQSVTVTFDMGAAAASTANQIAYFKYRCGDKVGWSSDLVSATKAANGTANVRSTATLYYGSTFPSNTTALLFVYLTNSSHTVTHVHSNLWATTLKPR